MKPTLLFKIFGGRGLRGLIINLVTMALLFMAINGALP